MLGGGVYDCRQRCHVLSRHIFTEISCKGEICLPNANIKYMLQLICIRYYIDTNNITLT